MKITLDLDHLLNEGEITQDEYNKLSALAKKSTGSLAFNILTGFSIIAISGAILALAPTAATAILIGFLVFILGLGLLRKHIKQWMVLANICVLTGALMVGSGIITQSAGSLFSILLVSALFAFTSVISKSALLAVLATLMLSASIGAKTGYFHASYLLVIQEPLLTILLFTLLSVGLYQLSKKLSHDYARIAIASARTGVFLVNFGFWIGSLWGDYGESKTLIISEGVFSVLWACALLATAVWSWKRNRRWVLNTVATFAGIHFYTQWFEHLKTSPEVVLMAGLLALVFAVGLKRINEKMKENTPQH